MEREESRPYEAKVPLFRGADLLGVRKDLKMNNLNLVDDQWMQSSVS